DRDVLLRQLALQALHLGREALRERANRFVLGLLDQLTLARNQLLDGLQQFGFTLRTEGELLPDPIAKVAARARLLAYRLLDLLGAHGVVRPDGGHRLVKRRTVSSNVRPDSTERMGSRRWPHTNVKCGAQATGMPEITLLGIAQVKMRAIYSKYWKYCTYKY